MRLVVLIYLIVLALSFIVPYTFLSGVCSFLGSFTFWVLSSLIVIVLIFYSVRRWIK
ncbi:MAG: hypothetical protein QXY40_07970 [Candidatus Methanomethylicia archaeon]